MYFTIYRDNQNQYRFNFKGENHEIVASGESYPEKASVEHAVRLLNGRNGYRVVDETAGLLGSFMPSPVSSGGLGWHNTRPSVATLGVMPWAGGLGGLLDHATKK